MKEVNFYCVEEEPSVFLYSLCSQIFTSGKRAFIYLQDEETLQKLDSFLWTCKKTDFLPHLLSNEKGADRTPILLSKELERTNNADYLFLNKFVEAKEYLALHEKIFYFYEEGGKENSKTDWEKFKTLGGEMSHFKKKDGKWEKSSL